MNSLSPAMSRTHAEDAAAELLALRYLPTQSPQHGPFPGVHGNRPEISPPTGILSGLNDQSLLEQNIFDNQDGIFLPGSAYQELHSTLRDHLIYTARSNAPTRPGTPELQQPDMRFFEKGQEKTASDHNDDRREPNPESNRSSKPPEISPQREYVLWKTWIDEVAPWVRQLRMSKH